MGKFDENEYNATLGLDFIQTNYKSQDGKEYQIKIWDTAGHERFRTMTKTFYKKADGIIITYDIT